MVSSEVLWLFLWKIGRCYIQKIVSKKKKGKKKKKKTEKADYWMERWIGIMFFSSLVVFFVFHDHMS